MNSIFKVCVYGNYPECKDLVNHSENNFLTQTTRHEFN